MRISGNWKIWTPLLIVAAIVSIAVAWLSDPVGSTSFDTGTNGLWIGHKWYTGREVRTGDSVPPEDIARLVERMRSANIRYVFVHVGPARADGDIEDSAAPLFVQLRQAYPEGVFLAWLGARRERVALDQATWRSNIATQNERLRAEGFDGVHFNLEPLRDAEPGYLELLAAVREQMGDEWFISQATPRSALFGMPLAGIGRNFWSAGFYRATMEFANQSVLMAYDTNLGFERFYVAFVRDQTRRLAQWACAARSHELLIGIPAYQDAPNDPASRVENIRNASRGVRSALESLPERPKCFGGVSVYANWVTDDAEWSDFEKHWANPIAD
ncbi:MAG: hypothetical protein VCE43_03325 [Myxococcota bacterium]